MVGTTMEDSKLFLVYESGASRNFGSLELSADEETVRQTAEALNSLQAEKCKAFFVRDSYLLSEEPEF